MNKLDELVMKFNAGEIDKETAKELSAPIIYKMNRKKIKRESNTGKEPKLFTFEKIFSQQGRIRNG